MHFYGKTSSVRYTNENHIAAVFVQSVFTDYSTRAANLIASEWSYKNQNSSYWGRFLWNFDQGKGNLVRVSGKFELSEFKLSESKWLTGGVKSKGNGTRVSVEFERFYCSFLTATVFCIVFPGLSLRSVRSRFAFLKALNSDVERLLLPVTDFRAADSYSLSTATLLSCEVRACAESKISLSLLPSFFTFLALFFFSLAEHLVGFILVGRVFRKAFGILGLGERKSWWAMEQDFHGDFQVNVTWFFASFSGVRRLNCAHSGMVWKISSLCTS